MEKSYTPSAIRKRKWRDENPERYRKSNRENAWRITGVDINQANWLRDNIKECQICGETNRRFHVDHCHKTLKVRGLLCENCNRSLGGFRDDVNLLKKAIEYLEVDRNNKVVYH